MTTYDIAVIGAGPAGCMAAICAAQRGKKTVLLEKNDKIGKKLLITGHGQCNITNAADIETFPEKFGPHGSFYQEAFTQFSNQNLMDFFANHGLELKEFEEGRVFPRTHKSKSVVEFLERLLDEYEVEIIYNYHLKEISKPSDVFELFSTEKELITTQKVILAPGGATYSFTGSSGDGFKLAKKLGHYITPLKPGGIPLIVAEEWVGELEKVTLDYVGMTINYEDESLSLQTGELLFNKCTVSGPIILDMSQIIVELIEKHKRVQLSIDLIPDLGEEELGELLAEDFQNLSKELLGNYLIDQIDENLVKTVLKIVSLDPEKQLGQITAPKRSKLQKILKSLPLTLTGHLPLDKALVTCGGVSIKEIDPATMESKLIKGLYFAGEIIEICGRRGGYNLQQAFSTGYVAGNSACDDEE